jgi:hypothetical protein
MTKKKSVKKKNVKVEPKLTKKQKDTKKFRDLIASVNPEPPSRLQKCVSRTKEIIRSSTLTTKIFSIFRVVKNKCQQFLYPE